MPAFVECQRSKPVALVSGHPDKAKKVAEAYGIDPKAVYDYQTYDTLADNPAVDVVYVILPNSMHAEYTIRGHKAGKHVLCEKPMAASTTECEKMIAASKAAKKKLMIAYRLRYEPFNRKAIELCRGGEIGKLKVIGASNCQNTEAPNIRLSKDLAGGPVEDVGVYCLNAARYLTGEEPVEVTAFGHQPKDDPRFREVFESVAFTLRFPSGVIAHCDCSFGSAESRRYRAVGTSGFVEMDPAFPYRGLRLKVSKDGKTSEVKLDEVNHFAAEMDHFSECVLDGKDPRTPGEEGLADLRVIEAIREAARTGKAVAVGKG
jgi:predicted dehydrogenase